MKVRRHTVQDHSNDRVIFMQSQSVKEKDEGVIVQPPT
jgi:hypothetical protein